MLVESSLKELSQVLWSLSVVKDTINGTDTLLTCYGKQQELEQHIFLKDIAETTHGANVLTKCTFRLLCTPADNTLQTHDL